MGIAAASVASRSGFQGPGVMTATCSIPSALAKPLPDGWQITPEQLRHAAEQGGNTVIGPPHGLDD